MKASELIVLELTAIVHNSNLIIKKNTLQLFELIEYCRVFLGLNSQISQTLKLSSNS